MLRSWELDADIELVMTSGWQFELSYVDEFELFEKEFRNSLTSLQFGYDNRQGTVRLPRGRHGHQLRQRSHACHPRGGVQDLERLGISVRGHVARTRTRPGSSRAPGSRSSEPTTTSPTICSSRFSCRPTRRSRRRTFSFSPYGVSARHSDRCNSPISGERPRSGNLPNRVTPFSRRCPGFFERRRSREIQ